MNMSCILNVWNKQQQIEFYGKYELLMLSWLIMFIRTENRNE